MSNDLGLKSTVNAERRRLGLSPITGDTWLHLVDQRLIVAADPALARLPTDAPLTATQTGAWFLPETEPLPEPVEAFLRAGPAAGGELPGRRTP